MWATQARIAQRHLHDAELHLIDALMETQKFKQEASNFRLWVNMLTFDADPDVVRQAEPLYYAVSGTKLSETAHGRSPPVISELLVLYLRSGCPDQTRWRECTQRQNNRVIELGCSASRQRLKQQLRHRFCLACSSLILWRQVKD